MGEQDVYEHSEGDKGVLGYRVDKLALCGGSNSQFGVCMHATISFILSNIGHFLCLCLINSRIIFLKSP